MIEGYRHLAGEHCGTVAMRNLLYHYCGVDLPEAVIFGLGSGLDLIFVQSAEIDPPMVVFGRSLTMERDVASALGVAYSVRAEVARGARQATGPSCTTCSSAWPSPSNGRR